MSAVDRELEELLAETQQGKGGGAGTPPRAAIAKIGYSHEAMVDLIIAHPGISQNALAAHFGYTPSWISQVISSDTFQTALAKRREQLVDPLMRETVETQFKALVARSFDILQQKLNRPAVEIPDNLALRTFEIATRAAGYGVKETPPVAQTPVEVNIHLEQLGGGLVALLQRKKHEANALVSAPIEGDQLPVTQQLIDLTNDSQEG